MSPPTCSMKHRHVSCNSLTCQTLGLLAYLLGRRLGGCQGGLTTSEDMVGTAGKEKHLKLFCGLYHNDSFQLSPTASGLQTGLRNPKIRHKNKRTPSMKRGSCGTMEDPDVSFLTETMHSLATYKRSVHRHLAGLESFGGVWGRTNP